MHQCPTGSSTTQEADYELFKTSTGPAVKAKQVSGLRVQALLAGSDTCCNNAHLRSKTVNGEV